MRLPPQAGPASRLKSVAGRVKIRALTTKALDDFEGKPVGDYGPDRWTYNFVSKWPNEVYPDARGVPLRRCIHRPVIPLGWRVDC